MGGESGLLDLMVLYNSVEHRFLAIDLPGVHKMDGLDLLAQVDVVLLRSSLTLGDIFYEYGCFSVHR